MRHLFSAIVFPALLFIFLSGCTPTSYYLSPTNGNAMPYRPTPLIADSLKTAFYVNGMYTIGAANQGVHDQVSFGQISLNASHNLGHVQARYGGTFSLGSYNVADYYKKSVYDTMYHIQGKGYFFGTYGFFGGMNLVFPTHKGEWRALGFEADFQSEFGDYTNFRNTLPGTQGDAVFKNRLSGTVGVFTDIIRRRPSGSSFGFKLGFNWMTNPHGDYSLRAYPPDNIFPLAYSSYTFHATTKKTTMFMQFNFGVYTQSFQIGASYRFAKVKSKAVQNK